MAQEKVLNVIDSNDVSLLCTLCAELMKSEVFNDTSVSPLLLDKVIIMNKGMQTYIQQKIASLNGICSVFNLSKSGALFGIFIKLLIMLINLTDSLMSIFPGQFIL